MAGYWAAPTAVAIGGGGNLFATNELPVDMHRKQFMAFPKVTPILSLLTRLSDDPATNFRIDWQESNKVPSKVVVATALASGGTALVVVANGTTLVIDTLLVNPRAEDEASVDATPTTNSVTISRSAGGTTGAAWQAGDVLYVLPPSVPENESDVYRNVSVADDNVFNYQQLIRLQFAMTRVANKLSTHFGGPGSKRQQLKAQKYREFREKHENMLYMGGRESTGTAPASTRRAGGLTHYLRDGTLYKDFNGVFTRSGLNNFLGDYADQNPDVPNPVLFAAPNVLRHISEFAEAQVRTDSGLSKTWGIDVSTYIGGGITTKLVGLPLLTDPEARGWGFLLDPTRVTLKTLDRATFFPDAKNVGESELIYDTYRTVTSMMIGNESYHAMMVGARL